MLVKACQNCGKDYECYPSEAASGRRFCGVPCRAEGLRGRRVSEAHFRLRSIWRGMKRRCGNPAAVHFAYYGARGIRVCDAWLASFVAFRDWALANGYAANLELDRIDPDGGYSPDNCRWATHKQQMANRRKRADAKTSRFKGVSWCANAKKWRAQIAGGKTHVGLYASEEDAARAYDAEAVKRFGEFALANFKA